VKKSNSVCIRILTATDLHQSWPHYGQLSLATQKHRPDVVAIVGDALHAFEISSKKHLAAAQCAKILAELPVTNLLFVRGNDEDSNWTEFVYAWPHERRKLTALYGTACLIGPLVVVGFPCVTGSEFSWCSHLPLDGNEMESWPFRSREPLPSNPEAWLPSLMRRIGSAGKTLWLMHESPIGLPLARPEVFNPAWKHAVERFAPRLGVCGYDHSTPLASQAWHAALGNTMCVNVGQAEAVFHYAVLDFEFNQATPSLPSKTIVKAFPCGSEVVI